MSLTASEVLVAGTGGLYKAPLATAQPADSSVALNAAYENLGYFTSDGVAISFEDSVNNTFAWQGSALVRSSRTETVTKLTFNPIQTRGSVLETFHSGSEVTLASAGNWEIQIKPATSDRATWVFDAIDGTKHQRWWIPNGEITERGDIMHQNGEPIGYPMTMTFYPDSTGVLAYLMSDDSAFAQGVVIQ